MVVRRAVLAPLLLLGMACTHPRASDEARGHDVPIQPAPEAPHHFLSFAGTRGEGRSCPPEMVLVEGDYCPVVDQVCIRWADPPNDKFAFIRCAEYRSPAVCKSPRQHRRFCIDREEYSDKGETKPRVHVTWTEAQASCTARGARLCTEHEWQFACEGEEMRPYPYGFKRDSEACNFDKTNLGRPNEGLLDLRAPVTEYPGCVSPFGVHNMVGNADEWTWREEQRPPNRSALRGGWWLPGRSRCRAATTGHPENYTGPQVGFRCCRPAEGEK